LAYQIIFVRFFWDMTISDRAADQAAISTGTENNISPAAFLTWTCEPAQSSVSEHPRPTAMNGHLAVT